GSALRGSGLVRELYMRSGAPMVDKNNVVHPTRRVDRAPSIHQRAARRAAVSTAQQPRNLLHRKSPVGEEAPLASAFLLILRAHTEAPLPEIVQLLGPVHPAFAERLFDRLARQTTLGQFLANAQGAITGAGAAGD